MRAAGNEALRSGQQPFRKERIRAKRRGQQRTQGSGKEHDAGNDAKGELKARVEKLICVGQQDDKCRRAQVIEKDRPAVCHKASQQNGGHEGRADAGGFKPSHQNIKEKHRNDPSGTLPSRDAKSFEQIPKQDGDHPDVETAYRKKVKRPRATEFRLDPFGKGRNVAKHHGDKQVGDCRIVHPFNQSLPQPCAGPEGERHEGVALVLSQNLRVISVFDAHAGKNALTRRPSREIELARVARRLDPL